MRKGRKPILKISVMPKGSIKVLGRSGKTLPFQMKGNDLSLALRYFSSKNLSELVKCTSVIVLSDSVRMLLALFSSKILLVPL